MDFASHLLSLSKPSHTHIFGNHSSSYGHLSTAHVQSSTNCQKSDSSTASKHGFDFGINKNYDF
jgi:hypothetical protein